MKARYGLWGCLALAFALRLVNIGGRPLWYDEAFAVLFAGKGLQAMLYGTLTPVAGGAADIHPLLYYTTLNGWMGLFGNSPATVRLWSVLLGVATVVVVYALAGRLFNPHTGLTAALITALMPFHVQYSQEVRMYALLGLCLAAATYCVVRATLTANPFPSGQETEEKQPSSPLVGAGFTPPSLGLLSLPKGVIGWWIGFGVCAGLAMYTQQLAAFYLVALGFWPVLKRDKRGLIGTALGTVVALVVYAPWLGNLSGQLAKVNSYYWIDRPTIAAFIRVAYSFLVVNLDIPNSAKMLGLLGAAFVVLFLLVQAFTRRRANNSGAVGLVLWLAFAPIILMWLFSNVAQPLFLERALLPSALMLYIALAWLLTAARLPRLIVGAVGLVLVGLVGIGLFYQYTWRQFPNSPYPDAAEHIRGAWQAGDVLIHPNKLTALPLRYYAPSLTQRYIADRPASPDDTLALPTQQALDWLADACVQAAVGADAERVWWLTYTFADAAYAAAGNTEYAAALAWLRAHYALVEEQTIGDLDLLLFSQPHGDRLGTC